ncbi:hypothetical protein [Streptomyces sp. NPDC018045]|uniref:hypothetical protein n=1 Tax=Streptomyces sp. NPDC018045 TaxID=3365037 RepID=UPI00378D94EB
MVRTGRWAAAVLTAVVALVLLGPGAGGPDGARRDGRGASFTLRSHASYAVAAGTPTKPPKGIPRLTPAFGNTGDAPAPHGVVLRVDLEDAGFLAGGAPAVHDNCYYARDGSSVSCEFPDAVPVGAAYETAEPLPGVTGAAAAIEGAYRYSVRPLGGPPPPHTENHRAGFQRGTGPALGLVPVDVDTLKGGGELRFASPPFSGRADRSAKGFTIRGRVGEYVSVEMGGVGQGTGRVRVELPPGTSFAPLSRAERDGTPSEIYECGRDDLDGHIHCNSALANVTLRVRIDRRVGNAVGRVSVREPVEGDTDPANNSAPIALEITGTAPPGETVPPVQAGPGAPRAPQDDGRPRRAELAVAASAAALALLTVLVTRRGRARRAASVHPYPRR